MNKLRKRIFTQLLSKHHKSTSAVAFLIVGTFAGAGLNFGVQIMLARTLGVEQFGAFASAFAIVTLMAPLAGFGLDGYWLNVFGREGWAARRWLPGSFRFLLVSSFLVLVLLLAWAWLGPHDSLTAILLSILTGHLIGQTAVTLTHAKYQLEGRQVWLAWWQFLPHLLRFLAVGIVILLIGEDAFSAFHAAIAFSLVALVLVTLGGVQIYRMSSGRLALEGHKSTVSCDEQLDKPKIGQVLSGVWPFGLAGILYLIYFQSDIILIKYLVDETAAGIYNVAFIVMVAVYLFPSVLYQKFLLPKLHRWAHHNIDKLHRTYQAGNLAMFLLGITTMLVLWLLVPFMLPWLFGDDYQLAVQLLIILAIAAPFRFLTSSIGAVMTTRNFMRIKVRLMLVAAVLNVILNFMLIPKFGVDGAAYATVLTEITLLAMYASASQRVFRK